MDRVLRASRHDLFLAPHREALTADARKDPTIMDVYRKSYKTKNGRDISIELLDTAGREGTH